MIFYTSDLHLGDKRNLQISNRPFKNIEDMDRIIIDNWNKVVTNDDHVYVVGDLTDCSTHLPTYYLEKLHGKLHLIVGNRDSGWLSNCEPLNYFKTIKTFDEIIDNNNRITLCHFPMIEWWGSKRGSFLVYGHVHNLKNNDTYNMIRKIPRAYNCGVDINNFYPVDFDTLVKNNKIFYNK